MRVLEIERRFLVADLPPLRAVETNRISQSYLVAEAGSSVRIRSYNESAHFLGIKSLADRASTLVRIEAEIELTERQFRELSQSVRWGPIVKVRHRVYLQDVRVAVDVDVFEGELLGLIVAEVEFGSVQESSEFVVPDWFGVEVTEDRRYLNSSLAISGEIPA